MIQGAGSLGTPHRFIFYIWSCSLDRGRSPATHIALSPTQGKDWLWVEAPLWNSRDVFIFLGSIRSAK